MESVDSKAVQLYYNTTLSSHSDHFGRVSDNLHFLAKFNTSVQIYTILNDSIHSNAQTHLICHQQKSKYSHLIL